MIEYVLCVSDDPSDQVDSVMLQHTKNEAAHRAADERFDSQVGDLLDTADGILLGKRRLVKLHVPPSVLAGHHDRVRAVQSVRNTILHL
jgi:hypothetical protein